MIADIFFDKLGTNTSFENENIGSIADLYEKFVEKKLVIEIEVKKGIKIISNRGLYERERKAFNDDHICLSTIVFFRKTELQIIMKKDEIQAFGLIVEFRNEIPIFLHQSFAEYFLALSAVEKIKQNEDVREILRNKEFFLVRKFLDDLFPKETIVKPNEKSIFNFKEEIEICCNENLPNIIQYLIVIKKADLKTKNEFLLKASQGGHKEIVKLLIEKGIDINQINKYGSNALLLASWNGHKDIVQILIAEGIYIFQTNRNGQNALHFASQRGHKEIVKLLIKKGLKK